MLYARLSGLIRTDGDDMTKRFGLIWKLTRRPSYVLSYIRGWIQTALAQATANTVGIVAATSTLEVVVTRKDGAIEDYGVTSRRVVTDDFVAFIVDALDTAQATFDDFDYMGYGSGSAAEGAGDTALGTEFTTQYASDNVRPTGTVSQPAANQFRLVTTFSPDASVTVQEAAPFSQAAVAGGIMMDRSLTGGQALVSGDSLQSTYTCTFSSGG